MRPISPGSGGIRVLHVDDNPAVLRLTKEALRDHRSDIEVVSSESVEAAVDRLTEGGIDCVVSDYQLPDTDGLHFLDVVRRDYGDLPFILFTGHGSEEIASRAISAGVTDYLQKSGGNERFELLGNRIGNAVESTRAERALDETRRRYERLLEAAPDAILVGDAETGEIIESNTAAAALLGRPESEIVGMHQTDLHPPEDAERYAEIFREHIEADEITVMDEDVYVVDVDGERIPVEINAAAVELSGETVVQAIFRDISHRE